FIAIMFDQIDIVNEINEGDIFLRKISKNDVSFFYESLEERDVTGYLSLGPLRSLNYTKQLIKTYLKSWERYQQFNYIIELKEAKKINKIGSVSLWNISWRHKRASIGIWILPIYWGKGIGKRALKILLNIAIFHLKLNRIEAYVAVENKRSIELFVNSNFKNEGRLEKYLNFDGKFQDAYIFAYLAG
ncbi:MAG: GNAT family N-acetyltransferase, partial [Candidatus Thorarchaeota archaeon]